RGSAWGDHLLSLCDNFVELPRFQDPNSGILIATGSLASDSKEHGDQSTFGPIQQSRRRTAMLHEKIPLAGIVGAFETKAWRTYHKLLHYFVLDYPNISLQRRVAIHARLKRPRLI